MRGLEEKTNVYSKILKFGPGFIDILMETGYKVRYSGGTLAWRHNNPGNLKFGNFAKKYGSIGVGGGGHAVFPTYEVGKKAMIALLFSECGSYEKLTVSRAIARYAPVSDRKARNQPAKYAAWVAKKTGISVSTVLNTMSEEQRSDFVDAMIIYEGFKEGEVSFL